MNRARVVPFVFCSLALATCGGDDKKLELGGSCSLNSDCADGLLCKFGACHKACVKSVDCAAGERCVQVDGVAVCQFVTEQACAPGCPAPLVCREADNTCRNKCTATGNECLPGQTCSDFVCIETTEFVPVSVPDGGVGIDTGSSGPEVMGDAPSAGLLDGAVRDGVYVASDSGSEVSAGCGTDGVGPLVALPAGFSIDATEVTRCQYAAWLATNPSPSGQVPVCNWNLSFTPGCEWPVAAKGDHPVVCVDWCDAHAYCAAVGKRLCGSKEGGPNAYDQWANVSTSQWFIACTSGGQNAYPYGNKYSGLLCNDYKTGIGGTTRVASMSGCQSSVTGYAGVYDLSGNVWEWEDSCDGAGAASDHCRLRGGSFYSDDDINLRCGIVDGGDYRRDQASSLAGFRCCAP